MSRVELAPGQLLLLGAPPGTGKTALTMQLVLNAMAFGPTLRVLVANVEMSPASLMDRQLSRLSGVNLRVIRSRQFDAEQLAHVRQGIELLRAIKPRLRFVPRPFVLDKIGEHAEQHQPDDIVLDYVQRIRAKVGGDSRKAVVDEVMDRARFYADQGTAVIAVAAVGRQRSKNGKSGYDDLNMVSFRESSELEYGADDAYILKRQGRAVTMVHLKARNDQTCNIPLQFAGGIQSFEPPSRFAPQPGDDFADLDEEVNQVASGGDDW